MFAARANPFPAIYKRMKCRIPYLGEESPFGVSPDPTRGICLVYALEKYSDL